MAGGGNGDMTEAAAAGHPERRTVFRGISELVLRKLAVGGPAA